MGTLQLQPQPYIQKVRAHHPNEMAYMYLDSIVLGSTSTSPISSSSAAIGIIIAIVVIVLLVTVVLLLHGGMLLLLCVLKAKAAKAKKEVREATDTVYDTIQEREVVATRRNEAYGHIGHNDGGGRQGD